MARQVWQLKDFKDNTNLVVIGEMVLISYDRGDQVSALNWDDLADIPPYPNDGYEYVLVQNDGVNTWELYTSGGGGENLNQTLAIGNTTSGEDIEVSNGDTVYFPALSRDVLTFDGGYKLSKLSGIFSWNVDAFAVFSLGGLQIIQASNDGGFRIGGTGVTGKLRIFKTNGFNVEHDVAALTKNTFFIYPDADVDFTGGSTGQVLTQQSNGDFIPAWQQSNALTSVSANYTALATDSTINCTANSFTVTLPTAIGFTGRLYIVKNSGNGTITVNTTLSQTMDGQLTQTLSQYDSLSIQSDGANWIII